MSLAFGFQSEPVYAKENQIILISFDGAHDNKLWEKSLHIAEQSSAKFTYFLSCVFYMQKRDAKGIYKAPGRTRGTSNIGFAPSVEDVTTRLEHVWAARNFGHEIGNHTCGHFDGANWSADQWSSELAQFNDILSSAWSRNGLAHLEPIGWKKFVKDEIKGFRAPYLSVGNGLFKALKSNGFAYDASTVSRGPKIPNMAKDVVEFALPLIPEGPSKRPIIAMDYNLYVRHSKAEENAAHSTEFETRTLNAFNAAFEKQYNGDRIPFQIGYHFVEMNAGAYWRALERFAIDVCNKPDVDCITYQEALSRLKNTSDKNG
ncbi:polysaccharide deacetylase family protein [Lentilitoribacter sp. EG35]|uniref:polysaccharide deacetylase family protein n=1 Tax=Lentilitoribacter sp. EG35 TaxID=3234192 RepID=UPI00345FADCF